MRLAEVDSERATSVINPTGASREGSGWSEPSKIFPLCFCLNRVPASHQRSWWCFQLGLWGLGVNDPLTSLAGFLGQW